MKYVIRKVIHKDILKMLLFGELEEYKVSSGTFEVNLKSIGFKHGIEVFIAYDSIKQEETQI